LIQTDEGQITEYTTQGEVEEAIWSEIHGKRFYLAEQAPICQGHLRGEFGYMANTEAAEEVLQGSYQRTEDTHQGTLDLFDKVSHIRAVIPKDSVDCLVRHPLWRKKWKKKKEKKEKTSSSESGLHFGHYIAGADSDLISYCHTLYWLMPQSDEDILQLGGKGRSLSC
jgi:stalled ribosome alternative rescue factor ArfA